MRGAKLIGILLGALSMLAMGAFPTLAATNTAGFTLDEAQTIADRVAVLGQNSLQFVELFLRQGDILAAVELVAFHQLAAIDGLAGFGINRLERDAVAGLGIDLVEANALGLGRRRRQINRTGNKRQAQVTGPA